jgi:guanosine-3',5'-bis(diphosphate) 3'-pyrophosphohydrolase
MATNMDAPLLDRATWIAAAAHHDHVRKTDGAPYIVHLVGAAIKLARYGFPDKVLAAALVHDVLEDTPYPKDQLRRELGDGVADIVESLTEDKSKSWEERKAWAVQTVRTNSPEARAVSLADRIHNVEGLIAGYAQLGPAVWTKLNRGREQQLAYFDQLLQAYRQTWQHPLVDEFESLLEQLQNLE